MPSIPLDLIAAIVDELKHDRTSLKACSLAAAAFCPPGQRHLFRTMWLHVEHWGIRSRNFTPSYSGERRTPSGTIQKISALLSESPHLATYVRHLTIELPTSPDEETLLEHTLQTVRNLETLAISGNLVLWNSLSPPLASTILEVMARPALNRLHLWGIQNVPANAIFRALSSMAVLSIYETTAAHHEHQPPANSLPQIASRLEQFLLSDSEPATYALIQSPRAPELTKVRWLLLRVGGGNPEHGAERLCRPSRKR
ncbi:hypothetical protein FB451DRAFT_1257333 [Mycena latifolia]|nr:hypothetical protein FB451DRAFT_1257333 [Mycena latifolia]